MITKIETIELPAFDAAGIAVRTTNQNGQSAKDIGALWTRFMSENLGAKINDKAPADIYCFYTDYESDHTGHYTALLGCKVNSLAHVGAGLSGISVPAGKYDVYSLGGKFPENVHLAWQEIWGGSTDRAYTFDFDLYSGNAKSFEETEAKIYLAVK